MAAHSRVLAWRIPGTGEPGGLPSMGSQSRTRLKRLSSSSSSIGEKNLIKNVYPVVYIAFPGVRVVKNLPANVGYTKDRGLILGSRRSAGEGSSNHSGILAWEIPWIEEPGGLQSTRAQRVGHN